MNYYIHSFSTKKKNGALERYNKLYNEWELNII